MRKALNTILLMKKIIVKYPKKRSERVMKKMLYFVFAFVILINTSLACTTVFARDAVNSNAIYILSKKCPDEYKDYAYSNVRDFILSVEKSEIPCYGEVSMGTPFSFANPDSNIFYFPILINGEICFTLRVFQNSDGIYDGILSKAYVSELNALTVKSSSEQPIVLMMENDSVVSYIDKKRMVIFEYPEGTFECTSNVPVEYVEQKLNSRSSDYEVVNIIENSEENIFSVTDNMNSENNVQTRANPSYKYLSTPIIETQGDESWCAAYSTAWIVRYKKGDNTKAIDIMRYFHNNPSSDTALTRSQVVLYGNYRALSPIEYAQPLSQSALISQIVASKPVYLSMQRLGNGEHANHAVVLRGYSTTTNKWSIWNPWYSYYDAFTMGSTYVPAGNSTAEYTYVRTIYNW